MVCASWENNKSWTEIYLEQKQKKMMKQANEILLFEDNRGLPYYLIIVVFKKKDIISKLEI